MADFTIWRFHECSANFNKTFFTDKQRFLLWMAAFFALFFVKVGNCTVETVPYNEPKYLLTAACGAFFIFIETLYIAKRLYGDDVRNLTGWILVTSPAFVLYGHFGIFQPVGQALGIAAILYAVTREKSNFRQVFTFGLLCGLSALATNASSGLLTPLLTVIFLRESPLAQGFWKKVPAYLLGISVLFLPFLIWFSPTGMITRFTFTDWFGHYISNFTAENNILAWAIPLMLLFSPWLYFIIYLMIRTAGFLQTPDKIELAPQNLHRIAGMTVWFLCTAMFQTSTATFPLFALLCALAIRSGFCSDTARQRLVNITDAFCTVVFPACGILTPLIFALLMWSGHAVPRNIIHGYAGHAPLFAVVAFFIMAVFAVLRKKGKIVTDPCEYRMNRCFAILLAGILLLLP